MLAQQSASTIIPAAEASGSIKSFYGYGEIYVPVIGEHQAVPVSHKLAFTGALRFETYPGLDDVVTPKLGVIYEPISSLTLKGSWGRSFKAPTLYQSYNKATAYLDDASYYASTSLPPSAVVMLLDGGNPGLRPERARTWSITAGYRPGWFAGFNLEVSYFNVAYSNRAVLPGVSAAGGIENPAYASLITLNPSADEVNAALALAPAGVRNYSSSPLDPSLVRAIIDGRQVNALSQSIKGVDISARYETELGSLGKITVTGLASYLTSKQDLVGRGEVSLAGNVYNPPHWRGRGGVSWSRNAASINLFANYIGPLRNTAAFEYAKVNGLTTIDATARYRFVRPDSVLEGVSVDLSVLNAFNVAPSYMQSSATYIPNYDPTNHTPTGRVLALTLAKEW